MEKYITHTHFFKQVSRSVAVCDIRLAKFLIDTTDPNNRNKIEEYTQDQYLQDIVNLPSWEEMEPLLAEHRTNPEFAIRLLQCLVRTIDPWNPENISTNTRVQDAPDISKDCSVEIWTNTHVREVLRTAITPGSSSDRMNPALLVIEHLTRHKNIAPQILEDTIIKQALLAHLDQKETTHAALMILHNLAHYEDIAIQIWEDPEIKEALLANISPHSDPYTKRTALQALYNLATYEKLAHPVWADATIKEALPACLSQDMDASVRLAASWIVRYLSIETDIATDIWADPAIKEALRANLSQDEVARMAICALTYSEDNAIQIWEDESIRQALIASLSPDTDAGERYMAITAIDNIARSTDPKPLWKHADIRRALIANLSQDIETEVRTSAFEAIYTLSFDPETEIEIWADEDIQDALQRFSDDTTDRELKKKVSSLLVNSMEKKSVYVNIRQALITHLSQQTNKPLRSSAFEFIHTLSFDPETEIEIWIDEDIQRALQQFSDDATDRELKKKVSSLLVA